MGLRRAQLALGFVVSALCAAVPTAASAQDIGCDRGDLEVSRVDFDGNRTFDDAELAVLLGGVLGAPLVARAKVWVVQLTVAVGLTLAAIAYTMTNLNMMPGGGTASSLPLALTIAAIIANFAFGVLLNFGVGNYAPTLVMFSLMGMDPRLVFPIMATGATLMVAGAGARHIQIGEIDYRVVLGFTIGGVPAVLVAALLVKSMPLVYLRWGVIVVVLYAATIMFRAAYLGRREHHDEPGTVALAD